MPEKTATEEKSDRNKEDIAMLATKVDALVLEISKINAKFDRWTGAVKAVGWLSGVAYALFNIAKSLGWVG